MSTTISSKVHSSNGARKVRTLALGVLVALSAATALSAWAEPGQSGQRMHGGDAMGMWSAKPERLERLLSSVNASDAQREQVKQILKKASTDSSAQREAGRALRQQAMAVFTAPVVDANAAEQVRQQMLAQHDQSSRRMMAVMLEVSQVLTAEQRAQLAAHMQRRERKHQDHHGH